MQLTSTEQSPLKPGEGPLNLPLFDKILSQEMARYSIYLDRSQPGVGEGRAGPFQNHLKYVKES